MHVTSHISNSLVSFSAHEMPIWSGFEADLQAEICANPRAVSDFGAAVLTRAVCEPHELAIPAAAVDVRGWRTGVHRYNLRRKSAHLKVAATKSKAKSGGKRALRIAIAAEFFPCGRARAELCSVRKHSCVAESWVGERHTNGKMDAQKVFLFDACGRGRR